MEFVYLLCSRLKNITPVMAVAFVAIVIAFSVNVQNASAKSECFDHWNGDAWHGSGGWAMVLCLDSATMVSCEIRHRDSTEKIVDLEQHWGLDRDRVIWTYYPSITWQYQYAELDMFCIADDGLSYTFEIFNDPNDFDWGACGPGTDYGGAACDYDQNEKVLKVIYAGEGKGTVQSDLEGVKCSSNSTGWSCYQQPTTVTLTAVPKTGSVFIGWSGACSGNKTCKVDMNSAQAVTATFSKLALAPVNSLLLKQPR